MKKWTSDLNIGFIDLLPAILLRPIASPYFPVKIPKYEFTGTLSVGDEPFYETKTAKEINRLIYLHSGDNNDLEKSFSNKDNHNNMKI